MISLGSEDGYSIVTLSDYIETFGVEGAKVMLSSYRSVKDSNTETFLREKAVDMELYDLCRTYLAISSDDTILGFVSLSVKCMTVPKENMLSGKVLKRMNIETRTGVAQSYLLGQLSRSADAPKGFGSALLDLAFDQLAVAKNAVGCRMVRLDCHDELIPYYSSHGFKLITKNEDGTLNQMMAFI